MKAVINEKETPVKYPWIGICYGDDGNKFFYKVVLFSAYKSGICLQTNKTGDRVGEFSCNWAIGGFTPFTGTITLSND